MRSRTRQTDEDDVVLRLLAGLVGWVIPLNWELAGSGPGFPFDPDLELFSSQPLSSSHLDFPPASPFLIRAEPLLFGYEPSTQHVSESEPAISLAHS